MINLHRTDSENPDFIALVKLLDADLAIRDGADHAFYAQFNKIDAIRHVVLAYEGDMAVGCGAIKEFSPDAMEVKRMFVRPEGRQKGVASLVLGELERWAKEMSYRRTVLETGMKQPEAIELYSRRGYTRIPNYGQYAGVENSLCFEKILA
jgi:GNAT superfamily N-acetyltransferase